MSLLVDDSHIDKVSFAAVDADDINVRIMMQVGKHFLIKGSGTVWRFIIYSDGEVEEEFIFIISSILDNIVSGGFDNSVGIVLLRLLTECLFFTVGIKINFLMDFFRDSLSFSGSAVDYFAAFAVDSGCTLGFAAVEKFGAAVKFDNNVFQILFIKDAFQIQGVQIFGAAAAGSKILVVNLK